MNEDQAVELVGFLTRSKAIWMDPELLNLVESAQSPNRAFAIVLQKTGSQRKAKAGRWYACAIRDFGKDSLGTLTAILRSPQGADKLERLLTTTTFLKNGTGKGEEMQTHGMNENPASQRGLDPSLVAKMELASADLRAKEAKATQELVAKYEVHTKVCDECFRRTGENPGGWTSIFNAKDDAACLAAEAVTLENQTMYLEQWLGGAWQSLTWASEMIVALEIEAGANNHYFNSRSERWRGWEKEGGGPGKALEDKRLEYIKRRGSSGITPEIVLLKQLEKFAVELREDKLPDPSSDSARANAFLALLYKQRLSQR